VRPAPAIAALTAAPLFAHEGETLAPHDTLTAWAWDPLIVTGLAVAAYLYWRGASAVHGIERWERWCYWAGWLSLVIALVSPLHPMGEVLFSAHMAQHEVLMLIAAPLLVLGRPLVSYLWALPIAWRKGVGRVTKSRPATALWGRISRPFHAWWIHALALWVWHAPSLFQAAVTSNVVHTLQHLSFLISALVFWWALLRGRYAGQQYGLGVLYVFTTAVHSSILGALLTFSTKAWYPVYSQTTQKWGVSPIEDQQIGGLIMWVPAGAVFVGAGLWLFAKLIEEPQRRTAKTTVLTIVFAMVLSSCGACTPDLQWENSYALAHDITGGDAREGKQLIERYGCGSCHTIPGIAGAQGLVGPPLTRIASRSYVAGVLPNTPDNMVRWIKDPPAVDNLTAMPNLGINDADARDVVTYLYTLR
jgi:putative membrane protein